MAERTAEIKRKTKETDITLSLSLDGSGQFDVSTGIGMLDHMLEQLAKHGRFDLRIKATGDIDRDTHHLTEDIGIVLGQAFDKALGDRRGITRFGDATIPLDETLALVAIDLSGRPHADVALEFDRDLIGELPTENLWHLLESFAKEGRLTLHVRLLAGANDHHRAEAVFKALARALRAAVSLDPAAAGDVPSTKDVL
ncbi:MAG: imidazoleglycerol-phosphate dehydratase HisB [Chloroflexi bacterium]|nr:imidazoleglycerol-phosphate dehydratase HisB [Chloroflexota bacterium]